MTLPLHGHMMVGIDPGVRTGLAIWNKAERKLTAVNTMGITQAMQTVRVMSDVGSLHSVRFEDARLRTWFGDKGREALMGAGSIRRDCSVWQEFLEGLEGVIFTPVSPRAKGVKLDAEAFRRLTGWEGRTSEHSRDAAMLVLGV
jgi:hypothetical protein